MNKILKKVQLSTEQSTPKSEDPTKGTQTNPYTQVEMATLQEEGTWNGGYVEGMGLVPMMTEGMDVLSGASIDDIIDFLISLLNFSSFELKCLRHYLKQSGRELQLTQEEWSMVCNAIPENFDYLTGAIPFVYNNFIYYKQEVNFYGNQNLNWALGRATVTFTPTGTPVGLYDEYNFDALKEGRTDTDEAVTRIMGQLEQLGTGAPYVITYGIFQYPQNN